MAGRAINEVPRCRRIVEAFGIGDSICDRCQSFIKVFVTEESDIDTILQEQRFKSRLARVAFGLVNIPRAVTGNNDPRRLLAIDRSEIFPQPFKLRAIGRERSGILISAPAGKIRGIRKLSHEQGILKGI